MIGWFVGMAAASTFMAGCAEILGFDAPYQQETGAGDVPAGGTAGAGGTIGIGGTGGPGGVSGAGGTGGGDLCTDGETKDCYSGPSATKGVGACVAGSQTCSQDVWGPCIGEVVPSTETCNGDDNDCNGVIDDGCICTNGQVQSCYTGPIGTQGVGSCKGGTQTCLDGDWGTCEGHVVPSNELCDGQDNDCDGVVDGGNPEGGAACMTGKLGVCAAGTMTCTAGMLACVQDTPASLEDCATMSDESCDSIGICLGSSLWSKRFGGSDSDIGYAVSSDSVGSVLVTGYAVGSVDFGGGALAGGGINDTFLLKLDRDGNHVWSKLFGNRSLQLGYGIAADSSDSILVTGTYSGQIDFGGGTLVAGGTSLFVAKLDKNGNHVWSKSFNASQSFQEARLAVDPLDNVVVTGRLSGSADFGGGTINGSVYSVFLLKLSPTGAHSWSKIFGATNVVDNINVAVDATSVIGISGTFNGQINLGGNVLSAANSDTFVARYAPNGIHTWSKRVGGDGYEYGGAVGFDGIGNLVIGGHFYSSSIDFGGGVISNANQDQHIFLAKYDSSGGYLWDKTFVNQNGGNVTGLAVDDLGNVTATGLSSSPSLDLGGGPLVSNPGIFMAKYDPEGAHLWSKRFAHGNNGGYSSRIAIDRLGNPLLVGFFTNSIDFGGGQLNASNADIFVAKFVP